MALCLLALKHFPISLVLGLASSSVECDSNNPVSNHLPRVLTLSFSHKDKMTDGT